MLLWELCLITNNLEAALVSGFNHTCVQTIVQGLQMGDIYERIQFVLLKSWDTLGCSHLGFVNRPSEITQI